jgi:type IV secretory pathway VirJ component
VSDWLPGVQTPGLALGPELARLHPALLCLHGEDVAASICRTVPRAQLLQVGHGHHLGGDSATITDRLLNMLREPHR